MRWDDVLYTDGNFSTEVPAVSDLLKALCEPGYPGELAGQSTAVAAFSAAKEKTLLSEKSPRRPLRTTARGAKLAAAAVVGSLVMGGVAAAAVTGSLPGPFQDVAHTLGLPSASGDPTGSESPDPSESADPTEPGSAGPSAGGQHGNGPSVFAVCWYVVHKTNGAAGGPGAVQPPAGQPNAAPVGGGTDPSDALDHGDGAWSQAYARVKAAAGGQSVLDYCIAQIAAAGKGGKGPKGDGPAAGNGKGGTKGDGSTAGGSPKGHGNSGTSGSGGTGNSGHGGGSGSSGSGHGNGKTSSSGSGTSQGHGSSSGSGG